MMGNLDSISLLAKHISIHIFFIETEKKIRKFHRFFFLVSIKKICMDICLARRTIESKFPIIFRHFFFSIVHQFFFSNSKKNFTGELEKKRSKYVWKVLSAYLKPKSHFKTQKQKKSIFAENYSAKTTKNRFFVKVPSALLRGVL